MSIVTKKTFFISYRPMNVYARSFFLRLVKLWILYL